MNVHILHVDDFVLVLPGKKGSTAAAAAARRSQQATCRYSATEKMMSAPGPNGASGWKVKQRCSCYNTLFLLLQEGSAQGSQAACHLWQVLTPN